jgi:hypothetical protein
MKYVILVLAFLGSIVDGFGQSKKEQLTALQASYDSLMLASTRERDSTLAVLAGLMQEKENLSVAKREEASRLNALLANCEKSKADLEGQIAQVRVELQAHKALLETQSASMRRCEAEKDSMEKATEMDRLYATDWVFFGCISTDDELSETPSSFFVEIARQYFDQDDAIYRVAMALEGRYDSQVFSAAENGWLSSNTNLGVAYIGKNTLAFEFAFEASYDGGYDSWREQFVFDMKTGQKIGIMDALLPDRQEAFLSYLNGKLDLLRPEIKSCLAESGEEFSEEAERKVTAEDLPLVYLGRASHSFDFELSMSWARACGQTIELRTSEIQGFFKPGFFD